jgi:proline iminopeptidase
MKVWIIVILGFYNYTNCFSQDGFTKGDPRLAFWQIGNQDEVIVVLHGGAGAPHGYLRPEFDALSKSAKVIYYDQRGCGKSDTAMSYVWEWHIVDLKKIINELAPNRKVYLIGSSWGSMLAILYAYKHQEDVKGLILSGTLTWLGEEQEYHRGKIHKTKILKGKIVERRIVTLLNSVEKLEKDTIEVSKSIEVYAGLPQNEPVGSLSSAPKADRLKKIKIPILLFNGTYNRRWDWVDEYIKIFPNVQLVTIPEAGHDPWFSNPNLFFSLCNDFIKGTYKSTSTITRD